MSKKKKQVSTCVFRALVQVGAQLRETDFQKQGEFLLLSLEYNYTSCPCCNPKIIIDKTYHSDLCIFARGHSIMYTNSSK